jgi:processive 1,2-diacylglycerol beta-glucosyltransferase
VSVRLLVTYVSAGAGHRRAAEAVAEAAKARWPDADIHCCDVLAASTRWFHAAYAWTYLLLVRHLPTLWSVSYHVLDRRTGYRAIQPLRRAWNLWIARRLVARLRQDRPDLVVATHFLPADVYGAARRRGWLTAPLVVVVTDLHPHRFWIAPEADAFVTATPEGAAILRRRGVPPERAHALGLPVARAFASPPDPRALRRRLGLTTDRATVLVTSGGTTVGRFAHVVRALGACEVIRPGRLQLLVVCGENARAKRRLTRWADRQAMPVRVFGFVTNMAELMAASDLVVAKAGGLTISEAMSCAVPLVLYHVIPGQERLNAEHVARHGAALIARTPRDAARLVLDCCVEHPDRLATMRQAAAALDVARAAEAIVTEVIEPLLAARRAVGDVKRQDAIGG